MKEIQGNLIKLAQDGKFDVIAHGCNCFTTMGAGIAAQIRVAFPMAYKADLETVKGARTKLGTCSFARAPGLFIVNCYTQYRYGSGEQHLDYKALRSCMQAIEYHYSGMRIGMPRIGSGLAGGDWLQIKAIIEEELKGEDVTIVSI